MPNYANVDRRVFFQRSIKKGPRQGLMAAVTIYCLILLVVTACAGVIGLLMLPDGQLSYLNDPGELLWYIWFKRAGLKVQIIFVTTIIFLLIRSRDVNAST